jgi:hypothetical protein
MESLAINFNFSSDAIHIITPLAVCQSEILCKEQGLSTSFFPVKAMWDTGSTDCCINNDLAVSMRFIQCGHTKLRGSQGKSTNPVYRVDILLSDGILIEDVHIAGIDTGIEYNFIVGMNIIRRGDLILTHDDKNMIFHFNLRG